MRTAAGGMPDAESPSGIVPADSAGAYRRLTGLVATNPSREPTGSDTRERPGRAGRGASGQSTGAASTRMSKLTSLPSTLVAATVTP